MNKIPAVTAIRIIPRDSEFLDRRVGSNGELFVNRQTGALRLYNGEIQGGVGIARNDLQNVTNAVFAAKAAQAGIGGGGSGNTTVTVSATAPTSPQDGNLWLRTTDDKLLVYKAGVEQWLLSSGTISYTDLSDKPTLANVATSGEYLDLSGIPTFANVATSGQYSDLSGTPSIPSIGSFLFVGTTLDTDDSSAITITPSIILQSDLTVDNEINANVIQTNNINVTGSLTSIGSGTPEITSDNEIILTPGTTTILNGLSTFYQSTEVIDSKTGATGIVEHDFSTGVLFLHTNIVANFTANFTNVPTTNNRLTSVALILDQGATAYIPNALQIDGAAQTIKWSGGSLPAGTNNYLDIVNFTLVRANNAWTVIGSLSTYN